MLQMIKKKLEKMLNDDSVFELNAQVTKRLYDAYIRQGFTKEEALRLVSSKSDFLRSYFG